MQQSLLRFTRYLNQRGMGVSTAQTLDGLRAAALVGPGSPVELMQALRAAFTRNQQEFASFAEAFHNFYFLHQEQEPPRQPLDRLDSDLPGLGLLESQSSESPPHEQEQTLASQVEVLGRTGFSHLDPGQAALMVAEVRKLLEPLAGRMSRRRRPGGRESLAWRPTMRRSLAAGGELVDLKFRRRAKRERRLVVLADVSGSMELSAPFVFHFLAGLAKVWRQVEVFVFATRLTRVTPWLAKGDVESFVAALPRLVPDLAGGTRLGPSLSTLLRQYSSRISPSSLCLIFSDGWDRGDPNVLAREMARLHRRCHRVVWLNPLLESPNYQPINRGMAAALPYVDHFLACHNLVSLKRVAQVLGRVVP